MKIHFTKKEYRLLLDMIYISEWIMNSRTIDENEMSKPYGELEQKILSYARECGYENLITYAKEFKKYYPTAEYELDEKVMSFIDEFEEESFWEKLSSRLAQRDLIQKIGRLKFQEMEPIDRMTEEDEIAEKYNEEFIENGVNNLIIKEK